MTERILWLDKHSQPQRTAKGGYEIRADCGLQQFVVELDEAVTSALSEEQAQVMLRELRPRIEKAAQLGRKEGDAHPESQRPGVLLFRITLSSADLDGV